MKRYTIHTERVGSLFCFTIWDNKQKRFTGTLFWNTRAFARKSGNHFLLTGKEVWGIDEGEEDKL